MESKFEHKPELQSFVLTKDGINSFISYQVRNNTYILWHSKVPFQHRGKGIGRELVEKTLDYIKKNNLQAIATCSYIANVASRSDKWNDVVKF